MDIYWIQGHEQKGPLPEVEVISMLEAGLIPENARAWHAGCPEWVCIRDLPALKENGGTGRKRDWKTQGKSRLRRLPRMRIARRKKGGRPRRRERRWWFRMRTSVFSAEWRIS